MSKLCDVGAVEKILTAEVQAANVDAEVLAAEEYPAYKLEDTVQSMTLEEVLTATVLAAEVIAEVLDAEDSPKFKPVEVEDDVEEGNMSKLCDVGAVEESPAYKLEDTVQSMTLEEVLTAEVLAAEVAAEVLAAEDSPKFKPVDVEDAVPDDTVQVLVPDEVLDCQASHAVALEEVPEGQAAQPLTQYAAPGCLAVQSVEDEKEWMKISPHMVKDENSTLPEDQQVLTAEVHDLAAEDKALAIDDQLVLIAEVHDLAAEDKALATEDQQVLTAEVHDLAAEDKTLSTEDQQVLTVEVHNLAAEDQVLATEVQQILIAEDKVLVAEVHILVAD